MRGFIVYIIFQLWLVHSLDGVSAENIGRKIAPNYTYQVEHKYDFLVNR